MEALMFILVSLSVIGGIFLIWLLTKPGKKWLNSL